MTMNTLSSNSDLSEQRFYRFLFYRHVIPGVILERAAYLDLAVTRGNIDVATPMFPVVSVGRRHDVHLCCYLKRKKGRVRKNKEKEGKKKK